MLGKTSEYALRALICLVRHGGESQLTGEQIARETGIPKKYLSKILSDLTRERILDGTRGKTGGFRLNESAADIRLMDVVILFERFDDTRCPFGNTECNNRYPCGAHDRWRVVKETQRAFLEGTSILEIALPHKIARSSLPTSAKETTPRRKNVRK